MFNFSKWRLYQLSNKDCIIKDGIGKIVLNESEYNRHKSECLESDFELKTLCSKDELNVYNKLSIDCSGNYLKLTFLNDNDYKVSIGRHKFPKPYVVKMNELTSLPLFIDITDGLKETTIMIYK